MVERYKPQEIEPKWQARWAADRLYEAVERPDRTKWYALTMFPYTSGNLHIGHWFAMGPSDTHARYKRMRGYNVLHPMGFDAFGLPAENAAIKNNIHPLKWTLDNVENMRRQLKTMGAMHDWSREVVTCSPEYYRWNQWFFLKFLEHGLAYRALAPANWCPKDQTVLANEQVVNGLCERCGTPVIRKDLEQWFFRITRYAEELMDFSEAEWPERIMTMQRNWIGKSVGAEIAFQLEDGREVRVFTTRADTVFGATFLVLAPEHPLVSELTTPERRAEVEAYVDAARRASEIDRLSTEREKTGVPIGVYAVNPLNGAQIPIWIADYVLYSYGTGAVMGVPAHDQRDFEFAEKFGLPIPVVIEPPDWDGGPLEAAYTGPGRMINSGEFDGLPNEEGKAAVAAWLEARGKGGPKVTYRIRDWLISRQRYWGTPIPIIYCPDHGAIPVPEADLPVRLPEDAEFKPTGQSPLAEHAGFVNAPCPVCGKPGRRETDTMDTFVDSSWYQLRYTSPHEPDRPWDPEKLRYWCPVDQYTGGAEHAVMHLLYARFFVKALRDMGLVEFGEPFTRLFNQGQIVLGGRRMSKSRGNVVAPDDFVQSVGADSFRAYLMFVGPWDQGGEWNDSGIGGLHRWLNRVWSLALAERPRFEGTLIAKPDVTTLRRLTHKTIKRVSEDVERFRFNTALAALMEFTNALQKYEGAPEQHTPAWAEALDSLVLLLAPLTPHIAEELWERLGHEYSVHDQPWPAFDPALATDELFECVIQVNGKVRDRIEMPVGASEEEVRAQVLASPRVQSHLVGKSVRKFIYVPGRLVNLVVG
jgi:leucyl-tRNA synthetase